MNPYIGLFCPGARWCRKSLPIEAVEKRVCRERRADLNSQVVAGSARLSRHSGPDCLQQWSDTDDRDHPLHVVGQNVEAHLSADPLLRPGQEVRTPIHDLKVPKGCSTVCRRTPMASGIRSSLACIASRTRSCFQRLIRFNLSGVHLGLRGQVKQAVRWRVDIATAVRSDKSFRQVLAGRTAVMILLGVVDEVLAGEQAALGVARCQCLRHTGVLAET
jgi:hypothetical protein